MKKILLIVMAAMMGVMANAQAFKSNKSATVLSGVQRPAMMQEKMQVPVKEHSQIHYKVARKDLDLGQKFTFSQKALKSLRNTTRVAAHSAPFKASALQDSYKAVGTDYFTHKRESWTMSSGVAILEDETEVPCLVDVLPILDELADLQAVAVPYTQEGNEITIHPTVVAEGEDEDGVFYLMLFSIVDEEGCIRMTVDEEGKLSISKNDIVAYGAWEQPEFQYDDEEEGLVGFLGAYSAYTNIEYLTEDEIPAPEALYEPAVTYYHIGSSSSGYGYIANYAVIPPYSDITLRNLTDKLYADSWSWTLTELEYNSEEKDYEVARVLSSKADDFTFNSQYATYSPVQLTASYSNVTGEPFQWGMPYLYNNSTHDPYIFTGEVTSSLIFSDDTEATLTRANTKDFGYYYSGSFLTPGRSERDDKIATLISYQGKPAAPLYITGVHLGVYQLEAKENFTLKCKIQKMSFDEEGRVVMGDVLAESDIAYENLDIENGSLEWTEFYVEDEWGMTEPIDYLFVEDEFAIVIEGWDNGTFECYSLIDGCEFGYVSNTYFIFTGDEEEHVYHYTNNYQHLDLGIYGGWGCLHTDDSTNMIFGKDGGTSSIHIDPMFYAKDDETGEPTYSLYIESITEDEEDLDEIPEWVTIEIANENYEEGLDYDMVVTTAALPEGVENRSVQIVFFQTGAKLAVTITQDVDPDGVSTIVEKTPIKNSRAFNLAGQPVGSSFKGVVVKDGRKVIRK